MSLEFGKQPVFFRGMLVILCELSSSDEVQVHSPIPFIGRNLT